MAITRLRTFTLGGRGVKGAGGKRLQRALCILCKIKRENMNLEQVARRAKVSTATVSRVLNNASVVKSSTRARVVKAIEELKYHPNLHARSLAGGKSRTVGVIASNMENPFFFDIYKTIENGAHTRGYEVLMANTDYRSEQLVTSVRTMI